MGLLRSIGIGSALTVAAVLSACQTIVETTDPVKISPVVEQSWDAVRIGTYDNAAFARFFTDIGDYSVTFQDEVVTVLQKGEGGAEIWLEQMSPDAPKARDADAMSWEPGCYWSLMMRAKDVPSIVEEAEALGWLPKTPVAYLEFGPSKLNVVVLTHQETGAQVQLYERLTTPLPEDYPEFERLGIPFNIMQMASDRDATYDFFKEKLGFATWYHGDPYLSEKEEVMPLGIPVELTTTVPYRASIVFPVEGMETGRFEMIEVMGEEAGLTGRDFSNQCTRQSVGLTEVVFKLDKDNYESALTRFEGHRADNGDIVLTAPDGASIRFQEAD